MDSFPGVDGRRRTGAAISPARVVAYALLVGESLVILIPTVYGRATPRLFGIPFFYWFQLLWIIVGMVVTGIAYLLIGNVGRAARRTAPGATAPAHDGGEISR